MNFDVLQNLADAVLYEGFILYPYRASAIKNQRRWNFGMVYPKDYAHSRGEEWTMQTECLLFGTECTTVNIKVRFLHIMARDVGKLINPVSSLPYESEPNFSIVQSLEVGDEIYHTWEEAGERDVSLSGLNLKELIIQPALKKFSFPTSRDLETLHNSEDQIVGVIERWQKYIEGQIEIEAEPAGDQANQLFKLRVRILNLTPLEDTDALSQDKISMRSLVSTHTLIGVREGEFISLMDPPEDIRDIAEGCSNCSTWPVLAGEEGRRDMMLSSPIILYDYPEIAPESAGNLFDGTEIDELLTLRIMTLTDEEKREMRNVDEHARRILERTEALPQEHLMKMHGVVRSLRPVGGRETSDLPEIPESWGSLEEKPKPEFVHVQGVDLKSGDRVRLNPNPRGGDIFDIALKGKTATIESIEQDFEDRIYIAVTLDDDPGKEFGIERMPAHRFFFSPEEVEPLAKSGGEDR